LVMICYNFFMIINFPSAKSTANAYISRLDAQNAEVQNSVFLCDQASAVMMLNMQKYLHLLQDFLSTASRDEIRDFLRSRGASHTLEVTEDDDIVIQYELFTRDN
jgi:hypothetical protein